MIISKKRACIEMARQAKLAAAKTRLAEHRKDGVTFDNPLEGFTGGITWKESLGGKIKQIALLPLFLLFVLAALIMTPIAYTLHLRKAYKKRNELEREIQSLETESPSDQVIAGKDLESLWRLHGLDDRKFSLDEKVSLLDAWIGVLYGEDVTKNLGLKQRVSENAERNFKANLACYEDKDAPHFLFASPVDSLVRHVSDELPPYQ